MIFVTLNDNSKLCWHEGEMIFYICVQQKGLHQDPKEILSLFFPAFFVMLTDQKRHVGWRGVKSRKNVDISRNKAGSVRNSNFIAMRSYTVASSFDILINVSN